MNTFYTKILSSKKKGKKLLAILLDPEKLDLTRLSETINMINKKSVDFIFVGGSTVKKGTTDNVVQKIKLLTTIPVVLFPGDYSQITNKAEAILFLSLLSGRNPEYLIEQHIKSVPLLQDSNLEIIPTAYILIDGGVETAVQRVSKTKPISQNKLDEITNTAFAGMLMGNKLIYLEAGSGAINPVSKEIINTVNQKISVPIIVGGGIKNKKQLETAYLNGADIVVIGNGFEENSSLLFQL